MLRSHNLLGRVGVLAALLSLTAPAYSQAVPAQLQQFLKQRIGLDDESIRKMNEGTVVTKVMDTHDKYGLLVFGAVYINGTVEDYAKIYHDVKKLEQERVYVAVQEFSKPPKLADVARLTVEKKDVDDFEKCKPGDCEVQIIDGATKNKIDWKSPNKYEQANQAVRQRIVDMMTQYNQGGLKALGSYRDREQALNLYDATKAMVDRSGYIEATRMPEFYKYLLDYPQAKLPGSQDFLYWEKIDFGQEPTVRVNHVIMYPNSKGPVTFYVANKQLYASRYIRVALQSFFCIPAQGKPGFYLVELNDSTLPDFGGLKLAIVRRIATGKSVEGTTDTLNMVKRRISQQ